jgi:hypothetical protein
LAFSISQDSRDTLLFNNILKYLNCGNIYTPKTRLNQTEFVVYKLYDNLEKIIPFFNKYPLQGIKLNDFKDFCRVALLMKDKSHLTLEGLKEIRMIKAIMNSNRISS